MGVEFRIDTEALSGRLEIELLDTSSEIVRSVSEVVEPGVEEIAFRVASSSLRDANSYRLVVRRAEASPDDPALMHESFRFFFEE